MDILRYQADYHNELVQLWEASVLATHHFLEKKDFEAIREMVRSMDFTALDVYCGFLGNRMAGFIGISGTMIEMLFMHPEMIGKGYGKTLLQFSIEKGAKEVEVNEQNQPAFCFYKNMGFEVRNRQELDHSGMPYPLLKLVYKEPGAGV
ncbi:GNAT family N-acetyltransferase [Sediminibacterium ginsengisoli]|uniref:Putative acetyltransferase n=1 Tax=Sediminibacterium ginsengisoli TaxID=413434 RepID=A0A1T4ML79_9BACT|nr:GNAT family N-acetyltransferase [Sediminibacterium ginsengisoli]SJZ67508.1 putative acetyltransferase [Sediminibacterium ginsengisoli]